MITRKRWKIISKTAIACVLQKKWKVISNGNLLKKQILESKLRMSVSARNTGAKEKGSAPFGKFME